MIDLRSDIVPPTVAMRQAMAEATTGDDLFGEDPTTRALENHVTELLGKPTALFVPTGTMANALAVLSQCPAEGRLLLDAQSHLVRREMHAPAVLAGYFTGLYDTPDGCPDSAWLANWRAQAPGPALLCLETAHTCRRGLAVRLDRLRAATDAARQHGMAIHLDGARMFHAAVALNVAPRHFAATADTVAISLYKGLGAPAGAVLAGPADLIAAARDLRLKLGGTMRQTGTLAAAGLLALQSALARDHALARRLAEALAQVPILGVHPADFETNVVMFSTEPLGITGAEFARRAAEGGVGVALLAPNVVRLATHRDLTETDVDRAAAVLIRVAREVER